MGGTHSRRRSYRKKPGKGDWNPYGGEYPHPAGANWPYGPPPPPGTYPNPYGTYPFPQPQVPQGQQPGPGQYPAMMAAPPGWPAQQQFYPTMPYGAFPGMQQQQQKMMYNQPQQVPQSTTASSAPAPAPQSQTHSQSGRVPPPAPAPAQPAQSQRPLFAPFVDPPKPAPYPSAVPAAPTVVSSAPSVPPLARVPSSPSSDHFLPINVRPSSASPPERARSSSAGHSSFGRSSAHRHSNSLSHSSTHQYPNPLGHTRRATTSNASSSETYSVPRTPLVNPLPTPPRDVYELEKYRPLAELQANGGARSAPDSPVESMSSTATAFLMPVMAAPMMVAPEQQVVVPPEPPQPAPKKKRGFFSSLRRPGGKSKSNGPPRDPEQPQKGSLLSAQMTPVVRPAIPVTWRVVAKSPEASSAPVQVTQPVIPSMRSPEPEPQQELEPEPASASEQAPLHIRNSVPQVLVVTSEPGAPPTPPPDEPPASPLQEPLLNAPSSDSSSGVESFTQSMRHHHRQQSSSMNSHRNNYYAQEPPQQRQQQSWNYLTAPTAPAIPFGSPRPQPPRPVSPIEPTAPLPMSPPRSPRPLARGPPVAFNDLTFPHLRGFMLSSPHAVNYEGAWYPSAFHLLEAMKFTRDEGRADEARELHELVERVRRCQTVDEVQKFVDGARPWVREDWDEVVTYKVDEVLYHKFSQHHELRGILLGTGDAPLIYDSPEPFWGGHINALGEALMRIRDVLREEVDGRR